tara:strand:+ start:621 stop:2384 length:1764 start_codon:yes stop_codon:yes gene_type:complete
MLLPSQGADMIIKTILTLLIFSLTFLISCSSSGINESEISDSDGEFAVPTPSELIGVDCEPYGTWTLLEEKMINERQNHVWTTLNDGRILLAGGRGKGGVRWPRVFPHTELFDPATGKWTESGDMFNERQDFAMFTLDDGRVLVAGGQDIRLDAIKGSEVWDESGNWTKTGKLNDSRERGAAVKLSDGRVLYTGGKNNLLGDNATTEIFDPSTNEWELSGDMNLKRSIHTATLLQDGRVIVIGGGKHREGPYYSSAELYDPDTETWEYTGSMRLARVQHTATLLDDGRVLVVGGVGEAVPDVDTGTRASAEIWDPATGEFEPAASMGNSRTEHESTLLPDGRVLVTGGLYPQSEIYDPETDAWYSTGPMIEPRYRHTATLLDDGTVIVNGGQDDKYTHITIEKFNGSGFDTSKTCAVGIKGDESPLLTLQSPESGVVTEDDLNEFGTEKGSHDAKFSELDDSGLSESDLVFEEPVIGGADGDDVIVPLGTPATLHIGQRLGSPSADANGNIVTFKELIANSPEEGIVVRVNLRAANFDWGDMELSIPAGQSGPGVKSVGRVWLGVLGVSTNEAGEIIATIVVFDPIK